MQGCIVTIGFAKCGGGEIVYHVSLWELYIFGIIEHHFCIDMTSVATTIEHHVTTKPFCDLNDLILV